MAYLYHRDQASAPALIYSASATAQAHFDALRTIIKGLISGYGAAPPCGWSLIHDAANSIVVRPASESGYVCFQRESAALTVVTVWLSATFGGVDSGGKIIGDGVTSGAPLLPHRFSVQRLVYSSESSSWAAAADDSTITLLLSASPATSSTPAELVAAVGSPGAGNVTLHFGDDAAGNLIALGGVNTSNVNTGANTPYSGFSSAGFTSLKYPATGLLVGGGEVAPWLSLPPQASGSSIVTAHWSQSAKAPIFATLRFSPIHWIESSHAAQLRGLAIEPVLLCSYASHASQALGGVALTTRTANQSVVLDDGYRYLPARTYSMEACTHFMTDNPEFWP